MTSNVQRGYYEIQGLTELLPGETTAEATLTGEGFFEGLYVVMGNIFVGRARNKNDIVAFAPAISRFHAKFFAQNGAYFIEDLNSTNGTFVNGHPVKTPRYLQDGDSIELCNPEKGLEFRLRYHTAKG